MLLNQGLCYPLCLKIRWKVQDIQAGQNRKLSIVIKLLGYGIYLLQGICSSTERFCYPDSPPTYHREFGALVITTDIQPEKRYRRQCKIQMFIGWGPSQKLSSNTIISRQDLVASNENVFRPIFRREYDVDFDICQQKMIFNGYRVIMPFYMYILI